MKLNKKQKRTATIASMAALLAVVLGMGGQTFAKYITTNTVDATSAVVAKWGVVIRNSIENEIVGVTQAPVFQKSYGTTGSEVIKSTSEQNVVAPGASGSLTIEVTGQPEVSSALTFVLNDFKDISLSATGQTTYYPITWSFNGSEIARESTKTMATLIQEKLDSVEASFVAGVSINKKFTLSWEWKWVDDATANRFDTLCGNAAETGSYTEDVNKTPADSTDDILWSLEKTVGFSVTTEVAQTK